MEQAFYAIVALKRLISAAQDAPTTMMVWTSPSLVRMELNATALQALKDAPIMGLYAIHLAPAQFLSNVKMEQAVYAMNVQNQLMGAWINAPSLAQKSLSHVVMEPNAHAIQAHKDVPIMDLFVTDLALVLSE